MTQVPVYFRLARKILWVGIGNFLLSPLIFLWQILYSFFRYAEVSHIHVLPRDFLVIAGNRRVCWFKYAALLNAKMEFVSTRQSHRQTRKVYIC